MNGELRLVESVPESFAELLIKTRVSRRHSSFSVALSGGTTARRCYEELSSRVADQFWSQVDLYWGDERCVPLDDVDSNFRLAKESLGPALDCARSVHPMDAQKGVDAYNDLIAKASPIDVIHLGLGPDGHTASLFPNSPALAPSEGRFVDENTDPLGINPHARYTFTYEAIARAKLVIVTVEGESKQSALSRVRNGDVSAPAALIAADQIVWLVDAAALGTSSPR